MRRAAPRWPLAPRIDRLVRAILTYHSLDDSGSAISLEPAVFRAHMRFLASGAVRVVPLRELCSVPSDQNAVALTFDDGFANFDTVARPLLAELSLPATLFIVPDHVGGTNAWEGAAQPGIPTLPLMDWAAVFRATDAGVTIGAHTRRHRDLTMLPSAALEDEVAGGAEVIAARTGQPPRSFAYPYGRWNDASVKAVRDVFDEACTTALRPLHAREDRALLPRLDAWYFQRSGQLEAWGTAAFRRRLWFRAQGRRVKGMVLDGSPRA